MTQGKAIIFSAPSGSGKTTIVKDIMQRHDLFDFSISSCTRSPREGKEAHGVDYYFLSVAEFQKEIDASAFIEFEEVFEGMFYGTMKSELDRIWAMGKTVIFDVDVKGGVKIKRYLAEKALSIFVQPPSLEELENRLRGRGTETEEVVQKRLARAKYEYTFAEKFDKTVINDDLQEAIIEAESLIMDFLNK